MGRWWEMLESQTSSLQEPIPVEKSHTVIPNKATVGVQEPWSRLQATWFPKPQSLYSWELSNFSMGMGICFHSIAHGNEVTGCWETAQFIRLVVNTIELNQWAIFVSIKVTSEIPYFAKKTRRARKHKMSPFPCQIPMTLPVSPHEDLNIKCCKFD